MSHQLLIMMSLRWFTFVAFTLQKISIRNEFDDNLATSLCYNEQKGWWI